jgi:CheY-like chemotaxis protein
MTMPAILMCDPAPSVVGGTVAFNRRQLLRREASTQDIANTVARVPAGQRLLQVLIVDNERDTTDALARLVRHWGHDSRRAYDGATALDVALVQQPDVVLLDIAMPGMDGRRVARQLRLDDRQKECFIIAITGYVDEQRRQRCVDAGIDLLLVKPVDASVLETLLMLEHEHLGLAQTDALTRNLPGHGQPRWGEIRE